MDYKSHPVWVRGLKHALQNRIYHHLASHPVWVRGLKQHKSSRIFASGGVAPRVGAWIETSFKVYPSVLNNVAPRVGAWIETFQKLRNQYHAQSHPVWVRGLKQLATA